MRLAFGAEWVQLFPKDSRENTTNEYEPFTFNMYGAKIPLPSFRSTPTGLRDDPAATGDEAVDGTGLSSQSADGTQTEMGASPAGITSPSLDAATAGVLNVYMEVSDEGDYEVMYGNPSLVSDGKWVTVQFKSTRLRVGSPWAECSDPDGAGTIGASTYDVGSIMPVLFGGPNLNSIALFAGNPSYNDVISELEGVTVPVKVVLEVFNAEKKTYTDSGVEGQCYRAGNPCPEAHVVCKAEYCEMDVWKSLIAGFKAAGTVAVLGSVGAGTTTSEYADLDMDGFYFTGDEVEAGFSGFSVLALGSPLFDTGVNAATVFVTLASNDLGLWNPFSWYPYESPTKWAAIVTERSTVDDVSVLFDRGYGWVYLTSETGFETKSTITTDLIDAIELTATGRRLQARRLTASAPFWGCDGTLFECKPICMKKMGITTTKVADSLCSAAPMDQCACKCFHEAQWTCEGSSVVCKAKYGAGELKTVGDKVCETRGAAKPASTAELRVDSSCTPVTEMRGSSPTAQCLAQWATPAPTDAPWAPEDLTLLDESFATTFALAALALYA